MQGMGVEEPGTEGSGLEKREINAMVVESGHFRI